MLAVNANYKFGQAKDRAISHNEFFLCICLTRRRNLFHPNTYSQFTATFPRTGIFTSFLIVYQFDLLFFLVLCCSLLNKQQEKKHCTATKQMKRKLKTFFLSPIINVLEFKNEMKEENEKKHDGHFSIKHFTSMCHMSPNQCLV